MSPRASTTTPEAVVVGVHSATTLSCHRTSASEMSAPRPAGGAEAAVIGPASAVSAVSAITVSGPAATSSVRVHTYSRPWNASGRSDSTV